MEATIPFLTFFLLTVGFGLNGWVQHRRAKVLASKSSCPSAYTLAHDPLYSMSATIALTFGILTLGLTPALFC